MSNQRDQRRSSATLLRLIAFINVLLRVAAVETAGWLAMFVLFFNEKTFVGVVCLRDEDGPPSQFTSRKTNDGEESKSNAAAERRRQMFGESDAPPARRCTQRAAVRHERLQNNHGITQIFVRALTGSVRGGRITQSDSKNNNKRIKTGNDRRGFNVAARW